MPTTITASWISSLARSLRTIAANLDVPLRHTVCRDLTARALGCAHDHELSRRIGRGGMPELRPDHEVPADERERRRDRQVELLRGATGLDGEAAEAAWMAWRPTGHLRVEALERLPPAAGAVRMSDIAASPGARLDAGFHLFARHLARSRGWDWGDPAVRREAMRLAAAVEEAGLPLDRPYPDQIRPTAFRSGGQARSYLRAAGFEADSVDGFHLNLAPLPGEGPDAFVRLYAAASGGAVRYWIGTNVLSLGADA